jgi:flagellar motor switch protein FliN/FliY
MANSTPETTDDPAAAITGEHAPATAPQPAPGPKPQPRRRKIRLTQLPNYTLSLLRVELPVVVILADKRQPLGRIVEMGPGSIIQFDKSCEEMLELHVGGHPVATGEAVKVGDKFGLRITSIVLPEERFQPVRPPQ